MCVRGQVPWWLYAVLYCAAHASSTSHPAMPSAQEFAAVEEPLFGCVSSQLAAAREQARVAELKTGEAVQVGCVL